MDRVAAARERIRANQAQLGSLELPCVQCRHYSLACAHPAVARLETDVESGTGKLIPLSAKAARAEDGPCGPEAALFEERSLPAAVFIQMFYSTGGRLVLGFIALVGASWLLG